MLGEKGKRLKIFRIFGHRSWPVLELDNTYDSLRITNDQIWTADPVGTKHDRRLYEKTPLNSGDLKLPHQSVAKVHLQATFRIDQLTLIRTSQRLLPSRRQLSSQKSTIRH